MATEDGMLDPPHGSDGSPGSARSHDARREPELLPSDWPSPVTWGAALGAGGEVLDGAPDLVQLGRDHELATDEPEAGPGRTRRAPRSGPGTFSRTLRPRPRSLRLPTLGATVMTGIVVGLVGLMLLVLFSSSGWAPASSGEPVAGLSSAPPRPRVNLADLTVASQRLAVRMKKAARERHHATIRHRRELVRRRARERRSAPAPVTRPVTRQVATPAAASPAPSTSSPSVSPAEREFTPGPWNLS